MDIPSFSSLDQLLDCICRQGVEHDVFPGVSAGIFTAHENNERKIISTFGQTCRDGNAAAIDNTIIFDLASLTKPLATTLSLLCLLNTDRISLDDRYGDISRRKIPADKRFITIAHLLSHSSGFAPYKPYFKRFSPCYDEEHKIKIIEALVQEPLEYEIGTDCRYSDLGFILLGDIIEQVSREPLDVYFKENITRPLGLENDLFYLPFFEKKSIGQNQFAATEHCAWRNRVIQGEVHDEHCFLMGGVAGHAGLFGTINGVLSLCIHILKKWQGSISGFPVGKRILDSALQQHYPDKTWCLGFDTPSATAYTSAGKYVSRKSVGHLGYTGTSFWIDPEKNTIMVLLTNRVHPSRENNKIREFRPWFHDRIMEFLFPSR